MLLCYTASLSPARPSFPPSQYCQHLLSTMQGVAMARLPTGTAMLRRAVPFGSARLAPRPLVVRAAAQQKEQQSVADQLGSSALLAAALVTPFLLDTGAAQAISGEFGILEVRSRPGVSLPPGRPGSLAATDCRTVCGCGRPEQRVTSCMPNAALAAMSADGMWSQQAEYVAVLLLLRRGRGRGSGWEGRRAPILPDGL